MSLIFFHPQSRPFARNFHASCTDNLCIHVNVFQRSGLEETIRSRNLLHTRDFRMKWLEWFCYYRLTSIYLWKHVPNLTEIRNVIITDFNINYCKFCHFMSSGTAFRAHGRTKTDKQAWVLGLFPPTSCAACPGLGSAKKTNLKVRTGVRFSGGLGPGYYFSRWLGFWPFLLHLTLHVNVIYNIHI